MQLNSLCMCAASFQLYIHVYADIGQNYLVNKAKMFYQSFYEYVRQVMVFKWMLICMIQVMNIFSPANLVHIIWCNITLNETLLHPMLTCTFHSPVRAVTSGLWHKGSHRQGCEIRALTIRGCDIRALFDSGLLCQGLMIFLLNCFFPVAFRRRKYRWAWPQGSLLSLLYKKYLWIKYSSIQLTFNKGKEMCITMHVTK